LALSRHLAIHRSTRLPLPDRAAPRGELDFQGERVTRHDLLPEAAALDSGEQRDLTLRVLVGEQQHGAGLCERLDDQHPGHDREAWKVALEEPFIASYVLDGNDARAGVH